MNFFEQAKELVRNLNERMNPSVYDTAWVNRLRPLYNGSRPWTDWGDWLLARQYPDGSWGGSVLYYHDRILCTLITMIALSETVRTPQARKAIHRGERYLWQHMHLLSHDTCDLVGFELIFPALLDEASALGLNVPAHASGYRAIQSAKLKLIPVDQVYSADITLVHSLEFLGQRGNAQSMQPAVAPNGALGCSPATTAYYLLRCNGQDERALAFLESMYRERSNFVSFRPFDVYELAWVLNNLCFSGLHVSDFADCRMLEKLATALGEKGAGFSAEFLPDADTTAVCMWLLADAHCPVDAQILVGFEDREKHIFRTYQYERNPSVSTNVHVLDAISLMPDYPDRERVQAQVVETLLKERIFGIYWTDKWHVSPYYPTFHALAALLRETRDLDVCRLTIDWLIHSQEDSGAWGFLHHHSTAEETAYCLQTLMLWKRHGGQVSQDIIKKGIDWLVDHMALAAPPLWIVKSLYCPEAIVQSTILNTLIMAEQEGII